VIHAIDFDPETLWLSGGCKFAEKTIAAEEEKIFTATPTVIST
jgi:hypothetical protein